MPKFNAGRFLEANDLQLVGPGEKEGMVRVMDTGGVEKTLNLSKMLAEKNIQADEIVVNNPENALNVSPVDLLDRAALSFGNAKGQLSYLKKNYQDAKVVDGDIMVKNKGVWQKMDASGLGDGSGWDMAKEFAKDILDWTGEAPVIAGQIAGAAAGGVSGTAAAPGVGTLAGASAVAGVGAGVGRTASIVMGRMLGTYEGDAAEITKDIAMDTVLSAAGEFVALGAKHEVLPKMKAAFSKFSQVADPKVKDVAAGMLRQGAGYSEIGAYTVLKEPEEVFRVVEQAQKAAGPGATADLVTQQARQQAVNLLSLGTENAQKDLSRHWRMETAKAVAEVADDHVIDVTQPILKSINELKLNMDILDIVPVKGANGPDLVKFVPKKPELVAAELGVSPSEARQLARKMGEFASGANSLLAAQNGKPKMGKEAAKEAIKLLSTFKGMAEEVASINPEAARTIKPIIAQIKDGFRSQFPTKAQTILSSADSYYASNIDYVVEAMRAGRSEKGVEGLLSQVKNGGTVNIPNMIESLASRKPGGESWKKALHHRISAIETVDSTPSGTFGAITRPVVRGAAKAYYSTAKGAAMGGQMLKGLSEKARLDLLTNPQAFEALSGEVMRSLGK